uniref:Uncharacterized protein n=1 Tax=Glossina brevipalpis TaxID=37001 RepID=A0A1A9WBX0_9MUSC
MKRTGKQKFLQTYMGLHPPTILYWNNTRITLILAIANSITSSPTLIQVLPYSLVGCPYYVLTLTLLSVKECVHVGGCSIFCNTNGVAITSTYFNASSWTSSRLDSALRKMHLIASILRANILPTLAVMYFMSSVPFFNSTRALYSFQK